jgi:hypothetical protein
MRTLTGEICLTQRGVSAAAWSSIRLLPRKNRGGDRERSEDLFWICRLKEKPRLLPISYAFLRSFGLWHRGDLFAEFRQRTYSDDIWVYFDPGPEHVPDDPPFGALQFTSDEVESVLQDLDVNKGPGPDHVEKLYICFRKIIIFSF